MALRAYGDGSLFGEASGEGPPQVLALHGWARRGSDFAASLQGFSFIALDLPGFGATPAPAAATGAAGYALAIEPVLREFPGQFVLVGHSFGGRVAVHLAAARPDLVKGLILSGVPLLRRPGSRRVAPVFRMARWGAKVGLIPSETMERLRRRHGSADYRRAEGVMRQILVKAVSESYEEQLAQLALPVELLWGADDVEVPVTVAERAEALLTAAGSEVKLVIASGVGHLLPVTAPAQLHRAVAEMIGR